MKAARISACACACAAALLTLLSACGGSSPSVTASNQPTAPATQAQGSSQVPAGNQAPAQLTVAQAGVIFNAYLPEFDELGTNPSQADHLTTGPERTAQTFLKGQGPTPGALTGERFLVPTLTSYPRWFLAAGSAANRQGFLFVMVQQSHSSPWQAAAELYDLSSPPQIMSDLSLAGFKSSGLFNPEPAHDTSLTTEPSALSAAYASYLDDGARGKAFLPGGYTTDYVRTDQHEARGAAAGGWKFADQQTAANLPVYGLQFPSGAGAMVIFYTRDTVSWTANSASAKLPKSTTSSSALPPLQFVNLLHVTKVQPGLRISASAIDENLAWIGPAGAKGVTIIVNVGKGVGLAKS